MNQYRNTPQDIHKRIYELVIDCFNNVINRIPKTTATTPIISQLTSSLTSVGANDQEADGAATKKDFIAKYTIVRKEIKETRYWLSVIKDTHQLEESLINPYLEECYEIQMIVSKIIENSKKHH